MDFKESKFKKKKLTQTDKKEVLTFFSEYKEKRLESIYEVVDKIRNLKQLPEKNQSLKVLTTKNINSAEILHLINAKFVIKNIRISFATMNEVAFNIFEKYKVTKLIYRIDIAKKSEKLTKLIDLINSEKKAVLTHVKNYLIECENETYIVVHTSANPKVSSRCESYTIENSKTAFNNVLNNYYEKV